MAAVIINVDMWASETQKYYPETDPQVLRKLDKWQDIKFGLLMHWGPYSQWGVVESWSICPEDEDWCRRKSDNYVEYVKEYENLKTTFNPTKFDPEKWAWAADDAGMKYVVFTTKHHDGFCMFDTKTTDYKITDSGCPFSTHPKSNITREIFDAFRRRGFMIGAYFSKPDWHCPYYWWPNFPPADRNVNYNISKYRDRWENFIRYTHDQVDELMTDYGTIDVLWLDGGWVQPYTDEKLREYKNMIDFKQPNLQSQDIRLGEIVEKAREKQPGLIVVDRAVEGRYQNYLTPENMIPKEPIKDPWESNIISGGGYSYAFNAKYMSGARVIRILIDIVAKGGNLLLNIAPSPAGEFDADAYKMLQGVGEWMKVNGECIYETRAHEPYRDNRKLYFTKSKHGSAVYAIYIADEDEKTLPQEIFVTSIKWSPEFKTQMLGSDDVLITQPLGTGFKIIVPEKIQRNAQTRTAWVFKITIDAGQ
ncbi:alpha-L-fucosidase [candidate division KSB1 bacterium]|nr:alpha-L-fucosidase [candidate division KSB1 bacterium]